MQTLIFWDKSSGWGLTPPKRPFQLSDISNYWEKKSFPLQHLTQSCNVIVARSTNHMILTRDHSHDLVTWSWHVTYKLHPDIKALSIPISVSPFSCYNHGLVSFIIEARVFILLWTSSRCSKFLLPNLSGGGVRRGSLQSLLIKATGGLTSRSTSIQDPVVVVWEESPRLLLIKATDGSHNEWWVVRLARRSLSPTLEDVNISFNHPLYYSMSRGEGKVVIDKR